MYGENGFTMQLHLNVIRNTNKKMFSYMGADTGFDIVNDSKIAHALAGILNALEEEGKLPKTVIYSLNPADYYVIGTILGSFQGDSIKGKIQFGSGWWFCDNKDMMENQLKALGNLGVLPTFIGMLTDSRSFLSYPRHEYFRRILCDVIGKWVENGEYPNNVKDYLGI